MEERETSPVDTQVIDKNDGTYELLWACQYAATPRAHTPP